MHWETTHIHAWFTWLLQRAPFSRAGIHSLVDLVLEKCSIEGEASSLQSCCKKASTEKTGSTPQYSRLFLELTSFLEVPIPFSFVPNYETSDVSSYPLAFSSTAENIQHGQLNLICLGVWLGFPWWPCLLPSWIHGSWYTVQRYLSPLKSWQGRWAWDLWIDPVLQYSPNNHNNHFVCTAAEMMFGKPGC